MRYISINKYRKRIKILIQISLVTIAIILILIASQLDWKLIAFAIGTSMLATVIITVWQSIFGSDLNSLIEDRLEFNQTVYQNGLNAIYLDGFDNAFISKELEHAYSLDLMYNTAKYICIQYGYNIMRSIEQNGCKVRILIADPLNVLWKEKDVVDGLCPGTDIARDIEETIKNVSLLVDDLKRTTPQLSKGSLEIRHYPNMPTSSIMIVNGSVVRYTPYLAKFHSEQVPVFEITKDRGGNLFVKYQTTFDRVWADSRSVLKVEWPMKASP